MQTKEKTESATDHHLEEGHESYLNYITNFNFYKECGVTIHKIEVIQTGKPDPDVEPPGGIV